MGLWLFMSKRSANIADNSLNIFITGDDLNIDAFPIHEVSFLTLHSTKNLNRKQKFRYGNNQDGNRRLELQHPIKICLYRHK